MQTEQFSTTATKDIVRYLQLSKEEYTLMIFDTLHFPDAASRDVFIKNKAENWSGDPFFDGKDGLRYHVMPAISVSQVSYSVTRRLNPELPNHIELMIIAISEDIPIPKERIDDYSDSDWELFNFCGNQRRQRNLKEAKGEGSGNESTAIRNA